MSPVYYAPLEYKYTSEQITNIYFYFGEREIFLLFLSSVVLKGDACLMRNTCKRLL